MKLIYSELKKFLPDLNIKPQQLRDDLTMIGHFTNYFEEIDDEIVFDLDIKVNRGDCLGYYGIARDLAVLYNIPLKNLSSIINNLSSNYQLPIQVNTNKAKRIMVLKISGLKISPSPDWLQKFIKLHGTKPINTLVDLTNYIMYLYGIPVHAFDTAKSTDNLIWEINSRFDKFTTLDGTSFPLNNDILMVNNSQKALSLSFWGGEVCAIEDTTVDTIVEIAVYDRATVRKNSRWLKATTEASTRLEKDLDPNLIPESLNHLVNLILENCGGHVNSQIFDYYPQEIKPPQINFDFNKPTEVSGIEIPKDFIINCLTKLGCSFSDDLITPPSIRTDITIEADLVEEVIRFWGYNKIPINQPLIQKDITDITPPEIYLIDSLKDKLIQLGYDEVLTWPLVITPVDPKSVITTQNSINSEAIYLRQSLIPSLQQQLDQYTRFKLPNPQFFEIGKVFNLINNKFVEQNSLCFYNSNSDNLSRDARSCVSTDKNINFVGSFVEIILDDLPKLEKYIPQQIQNDAYELTSQIITLDANITLDKEEEPLSLIKKYSNIIGAQILWEMTITDVYHDTKTNKYRYTFRVSYFNTDDKTAKEIHLKSFGLK